MVFNLTFRLFANRFFFLISQIPSSAVEMPGDINSSIGYLDVQFGAMDLIDSNSFDSESNKYSASQTTTGGASSGGGSVQGQAGGGANTANQTSLDNTNTASQTVVNNLDLTGANVVQNATLDGYSQKINTQSSISATLTQNVSGCFVVFCSLLLKSVCFPDK